MQTSTNQNTHYITLHCTILTLYCTQSVHIFCFLTAHCGFSQPIFNAKNTKPSPINSCTHRQRPVKHTSLTWLMQMQQEMNINLWLWCRCALDMQMTAHSTAAFRISGAVTSTRPRSSNYRMWSYYSCINATGITSDQHKPAIWPRTEIWKRSVHMKRAGSVTSNTSYGIRLLLNY